MAQDHYIEIARKRRDARAAIAAGLEPLPLPDQCALLAEMLVEREGGSPTLVAGAAIGAAVIAAVVSTGADNTRTFTQRALELLAEKPRGASVEFVAPKLYPGEPAPVAKKKARSILRWLIRSKKVALTENGYVLTKSASRPIAKANGAGRRIKGSVPTLVMEAIGSRTEPSTSAEILADVRTVIPSVNPVLVYGAVHRSAAAGDLLKTTRGDGKMVYALSNGGQQ